MMIPVNNQRRCFSRQCQHGIWILTSLILAISMECVRTSPDLLPLPCDNIKCPPMDEITCPDDSFVRDLHENLNHPHVNSSYHQLQPTFDSLMNDDEIMDELMTQCCVVNKCACKTCNIPACGNHSLVIYETVPESQLPGKCCGRYECRPEPDCSEVSNTDGFWLTDCQRCKCLYGERICHKSCDETLKNPATPFCKSKALNRFFSDGQSWKEGCLECECNHGGTKCTVPFCRSVNCEKSQQIIPQNGCCPICLDELQAGDDIPSSADYDDDDIIRNKNNYDYDDENNAGEMHDFGKYPFAETDDDGDDGISKVTHHLSDVIKTNVTTTLKTTTTIITTAPATAATMSSVDINTSTGGSSPCQLNSQDPAATYSVYPEVVEVVRPANNIDVLYAIIGCLSVAVVALSAIVCQMRAKQRSYRPVSNFDDNFNKTSSNIKKMNDYV